MNLGTIEQKSQEGLSRTLLYQILSAHRDLIPKALPSMWKEIHDIEKNNTEDDIYLPSQAEIKVAFSVIEESCHRIGRFCSFIDGLDEFVGDYMEDCITFIKSLAANEHIKIIVSSRPISVCVAAFTNLPKLQLQDLNRRDISLYVNDVIGSHEYMKRLIQRHADEGEMIIKDIIDMSSGVFLWVVLACRSLLSGFASHDRISELRHRVDELPPELENMFQHMLGKISKRYREQCLRLLRICYTQQIAPWPNAGREMYALGLAIVDDDYHTASTTFRRFTEEEKREKCVGLEGRLRSRCGGLLEVINYHHYCLCSMRVKHKHDSYIDAQVGFMHRTVFEFLNTEETWNLECLRVSSDDTFEASTALSLYGLHLAIESLHAGDHTFRQTSYFFWQGFRWAVLADAQQHGDGGKFFANLPKFLCDPCFSPIAKFDDLLDEISSKLTKLKAHPDWHLPLLLAIEAGAVNYVRTQPNLQALAKHDRHVCRCWPVLSHTVNRMILSEDFQTTNRSRVDGGHLSSRDMASLLLRSGCNPNEPLPDGPLTPWTFWLQDQELKISDFSDFGKMEFLLFAEEFLQAGANPTPGHFALSDFLGRKLLAKSSNEQLREKSRAVLLLIQELKQRGAPLSVPSNVVGLNLPELVEPRQLPSAAERSGSAASRQKAKSSLFTGTSAQLSVRMGPITKLWRSKDS